MSWQHDARLDGWQEIGAVDTGAVTGALAGPHWAAQVVAAVGSSLAPPADDFSHTALAWDLDSGVMTGVSVGGAVSCRAALDLASLSLELRAGDGRVVARRDLEGATVARAVEWLAEAIEAFNGGAGAGPPDLSLPTHELPPHALADGANFEPAAVEPLGELARWFGNAARALEAIVSARDDASPVRIWPHHFDIATLISLPTPEGAEARSVGVGLSPGDGSYAEPYWYVSPWPYPAAEVELPQLPGGGLWHREGFTAAVLPASAVLEVAGVAEQRARTVAFLDAAITACEGILI